MVRRQAFADPQTRQKMRNDLADARPTNFHRRWDIVRVEKVIKPENRQYVDKTIAEMAAMRNQDPLDAFLDLALDEDLATVFWNSNNGGDVQAMGEILRSPYVFIGNSHAGPPLPVGAGFGYCKGLLAGWGRGPRGVAFGQTI